MAANGNDGYPSTVKSGRKTSSRRRKNVIEIKRLRLEKSYNSPQFFFEQIASSAGGLWGRFYRAIKMRIN